MLDLPFLIFWLNELDMLHPNSHSKMKITKKSFNGVPRQNPKKMPNLKIPKKIRILAILNENSRKKSRISKNVERKHQKKFRLFINFNVIFIPRQKLIASAAVVVTSLCSISLLYTQSLPLPLPPNWRTNVQHILCYSLHEFRTI